MRILLGLIGILFFISFSFSQVCEKLEPSLIKISPFLDSSNSATINLFLYFYNQSNLDNPTQPIKNGMILIELKNQNSKGTPLKSCYVVTNENGEASIKLNNLDGGTCYSISAKFLPKPDSGSAQSCDSQSQAPINYVSNYYSSYFDSKFCTEGQSNKNISLCWFSTIIAGLIFGASFIMGRNPFLFFDFGVSRSVSSRFISAGSGYSPLSKSSDTTSAFKELLQGVSTAASAVGDVAKDSGKEDKPQDKPNSSSGGGSTSNGGSGSNSGSDTNFWGKLAKISGIVSKVAANPVSGGLSLISENINSSSSNNSDESKKDLSKGLFTAVSMIGLNTLVNTVAFAVAPRRKTARGSVGSGITKRGAKASIGNIAAYAGQTLLFSTLEQGLNLLNEFLIKDKSQDLKAKTTADLSYLNETGAKIDDKSFQKEVSKEKTNLALEGSILANLLDAFSNILSSASSNLSELKALQTGNRELDNTINYLFNSQKASLAMQSSFNYADFMRFGQSKK
jgi:hypothetical protein